VEKDATVVVKNNLFYGQNADSIQKDFSGTLKNVYSRDNLTRNVTNVEGDFGSIR
jgi:hypothetical protein